MRLWNKLVTTLGALLITAGIATAGTISVPNTFTAGTPAVASEVNDNFTTIYNEFNGNISNVNIDPAAAVAYSKLNLTGNLVNADVSATAQIDWSKMNDTMAVTDVGPHAIGGATNSAIQLFVQGAFSASNPQGFRYNSDLTTTSGSTSAVGGYFAGSITTAAAADTYPIIATLRIDEPNITVGASSTITASASLYISGAATEATENLALWVDAGNVRMDESLYLGDVTPVNFNHEINIGGTQPAMVLQEDIVTTSFFSAVVSSGAATISYDDAGSFAIQTAANSGGTSSVTRMHLDSSGGFFINDTVNTNMTIGLTVNQSTNDNHAITVKSSTDVAHGLTTAAVTPLETDDYFTVLKRVPTEGGALLVSVSEDPVSASNATDFYSYGGQPGTAKANSATGLFNIHVIEHNGSNVLTNTAADGNIFAIRTLVSATNVSRWILDEDGDTWQPGRIHSAETTDTPTAADMADDAEIAIFTEADCFVIAFDNAGTMTFIKLALDGADATWVQNTTDPTTGC